MLCVFSCVSLLLRIVLPYFLSRFFVLLQYVHERYMHRFKASLFSFFAVMQLLSRFKKEILIHEKILPIVSVPASQRRLHYQLHFFSPFSVEDHQRVLLGFFVLFFFFDQSCNRSPSYFTPPSTVISFAKARNTPKHIPRKKNFY